ncbi:MAG TPA: cupredoxin domain-containing protein [Acidimicrobiales bacterium]|nr:cupredoxin domain-containing protein [Acidimicrobiales bacterium]
MRRWLAAVATAVALAASGCGGDGPPVALEGKTNEHGTKTASDDLEVDAYDAYFAPTYIKASAGRQFAIELHNEGTTRHTFTGPDLGVDLELEAGGRRTVTIKAPASGHALFFCRFHQLHGMQGAVVVG